MENKNKVSVVCEDSGSISRTEIEGRTILLTIPGNISGTIVNNCDEDYRTIPGSTTYIQIIMQPDEFDALPIDADEEAGFKTKNIEVGADENGRRVVVSFVYKVAVGTSDKQDFPAPWAEEIRNMFSRFNKEKED